MQVLQERYSRRMGVNWFYFNIENLVLWIRSEIDGSALEFFG